MTTSSQTPLRTLLAGCATLVFVWTSTAADADPTPPPPIPSNSANAAAQPGRPASPTGAPDGEAIIVTANKRAESAQRVPETITVFSGKALEARGITNTADLQLHTPGLVISSNVIFGQPYIRGIGSNLLTVGEDNSVATYVDGIYLSRPVGIFQQLLDVERVEVLKGPQGTLYGRNATGGVINIISRAPTQNFSATGLVSYGNLDALRFGATLGGPLSNGISARLSFIRSARDGYVTNETTGQKLESEHDWAARATVRLELGPNATLTLGGDLSRERDTRGQGFHVIKSGAGNTGFDLPSDPRRKSSDSPVPTNIDLGGLRAALDWNVGPVTLTSLTGYRHSKFNIGIDLDASNRHYAAVEPEEEHSNTFTQELRVANDANQAVNFIAGLYYLREDANSLFNIFVYPASINTHPHGFITTNAYAAFGQANFRLADKLKLTLGARYSDERKSVRVETNFPPPDRTDVRQRSWHAFTPHFGLEYTPQDDLMLYATVSKGFKSGGFDSLARGAPTFDPEFIWAYEAGVKSSLLDRRLILNLSAFHYDYTNLQVNTISPGGIIQSVTNAAKARVEGIEAQLQARLGGGFSLDGGLSLLDAKFVDYKTVNPAVNPNLTVDLKGFNLPRAPHVQATLGLEYETPLSGGLKLRLRGDGQYRSKTYFDVFQTDLLSQHAFATANLSAGIEGSYARHDWTLTAFVRNVTNKLYATNAGQSNGFYGIVKWYDLPRTFGASLLVSY